MQLEASHGSSHSFDLLILAVIAQAYDVHAPSTVLPATDAAPAPPGGVKIIEAIVARRLSMSWF